MERTGRSGDTCTDAIKNNPINPVVADQGHYLEYFSK
jgi:hypothetical protein